MAILNKKEIISNNNKILKFRVESSDDDYKVMNNLFKNKHYNWSLFIGHLVIEKLLKAIFVKKFNKTPVFSHDLVRIAEKTEIELN